MMQQPGEAAAVAAVATMRRGVVLNLTSDLAIAAAKMSVQRRLPMADSIILATTFAYDAMLGTGR